MKLVRTIDMGHLKLAVRGFNPYWWPHYDFEILWFILMALLWLLYALIHIDGLTLTLRCRGARKAYVPFDVCMHVLIICHEWYFVAFVFYLIAVSFFHLFYVDLSGIFKHRPTCSNKAKLAICNLIGPSAKCICIDQDKNRHLLCQKIKNTSRRELPLCDILNLRKL